MMNTPMNLNPRDCPNDHSDSNQAKYFVEDYCKKYPNDRGNRRIYPEDTFNIQYIFTHLILKIDHSGNLASRICGVVNQFS
jgi:hypothetical protein